MKQTQKKILIFFLSFFLLACQCAKAQKMQASSPPATISATSIPDTPEHKGFSLTAGWGIYELFNLGGQWNFAKRSSLSAFAGSNLGLNDKKQWSAGLYFDQVFLKSIIWKLKPGYSLGTIYWTQDDELYYFQTLSFPFMAMLAYPVSPLFTIRAEGGVILSSVLVADRKQNVQSGYPDRFNGNFRLNLIYKLGKK
jgi:hypothetical protein